MFEHSVLCEQMENVLSYILQSMGLTNHIYAINTEYSNTPEINTVFESKCVSTFS